MSQYLRLGLNIDHVATLRNVRGETFPDPVSAARLAAECGVDGITAHLREDRRHIRDEDLARLKQEISLPLNMEMAATAEMQKIALTIGPNAVCLVPEKRNEITTEGGLNVVGQAEALSSFIQPLRANGSRISLFVDPDEEQISAAQKCGADIVELHTGTYCRQVQNGEESGGSFERLRLAALVARDVGLEVHAGHGLCYKSVGRVAALEDIVELNIGHFLIAESVFRGLPSAISEMRRLMDEARSS